MGESADGAPACKAAAHVALRQSPRSAKASGISSPAPPASRRHALQETSASLTEISSRRSRARRSQQRRRRTKASKSEPQRGFRSGPVRSAKTAVQRTERSQQSARRADRRPSSRSAPRPKSHRAKIIGTIDEIAFQTNLLALNAAVEAARAGDAGRGFAVVAEEVRALATRSAEAAQGTAELLDAARTHAQAGTDRVHEVSGALNQVAEEVRQVSSRISEVTQTSEEQTAVTAEVHRASEEQSSGIAQIQKVVTDLDRETQGTAALAEETAASSEELDKQAGLMTDVVEELELIVHGPRRA
jgi:methyl-accepting chemotaxis protein